MLIGMMKEKLREGDVSLHAVPKSQKSELVNYREGCFKVKVRGAPENNEANKELVRFLSKRLKVKVVMARGEKSRKKVIRLL